MSALPAHLRLVSDAPQKAPVRRTGLETLEDAQLVALACNDDLVAFETLYRRHLGFTLNLAARIQGSAVDVEDVVHDAFLRAQHKLPTLRDAAAFRGWLGAIVVRLVRSRLRRQRMLALVGGDVDPVDLDAIAAPQASPEVRAQLAQIYALLQTLPANDRIAWILRHIEHRSLDEVASLLDCSLATAKRRIQRAKVFLEEHFVAPFLEEAQ